MSKPSTRPSRERWGRVRFETRIRRGQMVRFYPILDWFPLLREELEARRTWRVVRRLCLSVAALGYLWWLVFKV